MSQDTYREDLALARAVLRQKTLDPRKVTEARLQQSKTGFRRPLSEFLTAAGLSVEQLGQARASAKPSAIEAELEPTEAAKARVGQICVKVLLDGVIRHTDLITSYVGRLPRDPQPVALDLIDKSALRHGLWMDFLETVRACKGVRVRNLVEVIEVDRTPEAFGVVTRYHKGALTLRKLLDRIHRLKLSEALRILRELAQGLSALHAAGLVHRDVKPENVLLGQQGEVQLQNAGVVWEPEGAEAFGGPRMIFGTPHSISPEVCRGEQPGPLSDIYNLGVVGYELVTGVRPFEGATLAELRPQHLEHAPVAPHSILSALPKEVGELMMWMLSKKPSDRPTAPKLVGTLQELERSIKRTGATQKFQAFDG